MSAHEQERYDKMSPEKKAAYNDKKLNAAVARKYTELRRLRKETGVDYKPVSVGLILDKDRKVADIHAVSGYHKRIGYRSPEAQHGYVTTKKYR
jgi:hypothetical protein